MAWGKKTLKTLLWLPYIKYLQQLYLHQLDKIISSQMLYIPSILNQDISILGSPKTKVKESYDSNELPVIIKFVLPLVRIWFSFFSHVVSCSLTARDLNITRKFLENKLDNVHPFTDEWQKNYFTCCLIPWCFQEVHSLR